MKNLLHVVASRKTTLLSIGSVFRKWGNNLGCLGVKGISIGITMVFSMANINSQCLNNTLLNPGFETGNFSDWTISDFHPADAVNPLPSSLVSPSAATAYYVRSTITKGCFSVREMVVSLRTANCGAINIGGPN
jgi:hypothetical protein